MKIGRVNVSLSSKVKVAPPDTQEMGAMGTVYFGGRISDEEYNTDLQGEKALKVYDRMRKSDGQVKGALLACSLPIREAKWEIKPASDSAEDIKIAEYVSDTLFQQMSITWDDFLSHVLLMLPFGFSTFEKVWEQDEDGLYRWDKLAPRLPKSIYLWNFNDQGGLRSFQQRTWSNGKFVDIEIPIDKALIYTLDREGSNYMGTSLLRAAYKHWYYKDVLYRLDGIAAERHGVGIALFKLPRTATTEGNDSDLARIKTIGESLHAHERSYVALPEGYEFDLKGVSGQLHDIIRSIEHHDMQIVRSILAQFINLGAGGAGSYAMSQDQSGFFLMALRALAKNICNTTNRYGIRQLVDYNWSVKKYPELTVSGLEHRDMASYATAISTLLSSGALLPDKGLDTELRKFLHLPALDKNYQVNKSDEKPTKDMKFNDFRPRRPLIGAEPFVNFKDISGTLDSATGAFTARVKEVQDKQIVQIANIVANYIEKGEAAKVTSVDIPLQSLMADKIEGVLKDLYEFGKHQVEVELVRQKANLVAADPLPTKVLPLELIKTRARATASILGSKLRAAMAWEALRQVKEQTISRTSIIAALTAISDREAESTARFSVSEAFNLGRGAAADEHGDEIARVEYSALMDDNTCPACAELDGQSFAFPSEEWDQVNPPYKDCEGRDRCRCVGIYILKSESL